MWAIMAAGSGCQAWLSDITLRGVAVDARNGQSAALIETRGPLESGEWRGDD